MRAARGALVLALLLPGWLAAGEAGSTAFQFLKLGSGARAQALGEAFVAVADDAAGMDYNPAGLAALGGTTLQLSHNAWFRQAGSEHLHLDWVTRDWGCWGLGLNYLVLPAQASTVPTGAGSPWPYDNFVQTGQFTPYQYRLGLGWGRALPAGFRFGSAVKVLGDSIAGSQALGLGWDLGLMHRGLLEGLDLGLSVQNLGLPARMADEYFDLPSLLRCGAAWESSFGLQFLLEADLPRDSRWVLAAGVDWAVFESVFLRAGYRLDEIFNPWSLGLGAQLGRLGLDLAAMPYGELGMTYRGSLSWQFDGPLRRRRRAGPGAERIDPDPTALLRAPNPVFENKVRGGKVTMTAEVSAPERMTRWELTLRSEAGGQPLRSLRGRSLPAVLEWDGLGGDGLPLPEGRYSASLEVRYETGQKAVSPPLALRILNFFPELKFRRTAYSEDPAQPGWLIYPFQFQLEASPSDLPCQWRLEIREEESGRLLRSLQGPLAQGQLLSWDGKDESGASFVSGKRYSFKLLLLEMNGVVLNEGQAQAWTCRFP